MCVWGNVPSSTSRSERSFSLLVLGGMVSDRHSRDPSKKTQESQAPEANFWDSHPWIAIKQNQGGEHTCKSCVPYLDNVCLPPFGVT